MQTRSVFAVQLNPVVGDVAGNAARIIEKYQAGVAGGADVVVLPELALSGYSPEDMLLVPAFLKLVHTHAERIAAHTTPETALVLPAPWAGEHKTYDVPMPGQAFNSALFCYDGKIQHIVHKTDLPNFGVFDERRYFQAANRQQIVSFKGVQWGIPICRDTWLPDVCAALAAQGAQVLLSPNASPYYCGKHLDRYRFIRSRSDETACPLLYLNIVGGQDSVVFDGRSFTQNPGQEAGNLCAPWVEEEVWLTLEEHATGWQFAQTHALHDSSFDANGDMYHALQCGLRDYMYKNGFHKVVLGLSGGVDSALVAALCVDTLGAENVCAYMLPSPYTSNVSCEDAHELAQNLDMRLYEMPLQEGMQAVGTVLEEAFGASLNDLTAQNIQSRLRGLLLMAHTNQYPDTLLVTTGNKSEMAVGYATLYGDMCGAFALLKDVYKTKVYDLCHWRNKQGPVIPQRILTKAPTAELKPDQRDDDSLPPYAELDAILMLLIEERMGAEEVIARGHTADTVKHIAGLLRRAEYKRFQSPPGVKVTSMSFDRDWRMPLTNRAPC